MVEQARLGVNRPLMRFMFATVYQDKVRRDQQSRLMRS